MSGGGHIILDAAQKALTDSLVSGQLPDATRKLIDSVLERDPSTWTSQEKKEIGKAFNWALNNLK